MSDVTGMLRRAMARVEATDALDRYAAAVAPLADALTARPSVKRVLSGAPLGHRLHPLLTDIPIGCWTTASLLDVIAWRSSRRSARQITGLGVLAALPTAWSGLSDWHDTHGPARRVGVVHMAANATTVALEFASWSARRKGRHLRGALYGLAGLATGTVGGYLGGHLVYAERVGVDVEVPLVDDEDWHPAAAAAELAEGATRCVEIGCAPVVLVRDRGEIFAIGAVCSHAGGPLQEGRVEPGTITCPWHGSVFALRDGRVERGPAASAQPVYETRVVDGTVQVRHVHAPAILDGRRTVGTVGPSA